MTRRDAFRALAGLAAGVVACVPWRIGPPVVIGPITCEQAWALRDAGWQVHAFLDGEDVTDRCFYADDQRGIVHLYRWNEDNRPYYDPQIGGPAEEVRHGDVRYLVQRRA